MTIGIDAKMSEIFFFFIIDEYVESVFDEYKYYLQIFKSCISTLMPKGILASEKSVLLNNIYLYCSCLHVSLKNKTACKYISAMQEIDICFKNKPWVVLETLTL